MTVEFIPIDRDTHYIVTKTKVNSSGLPRNIFLANLISNKNFLNDIAKIILPKPLRKLIRSKFIINEKKQVISVKTYNMLLEEYKEEISSLSDITEYDLTHWMQKKEL